MSRQIGIKTKTLLELIKEKDITLKQLIKEIKSPKSWITNRICFLRLKKGFTQIQTKRQNRHDFHYHWLTEQDPINEHLEVINSRTKKTIRQMNFSNKTNKRTLELKGASKKVISTIQSSQTEKGQLALIE